MIGRLTAAVGIAVLLGAPRSMAPTEVSPPSPMENAAVRWADSVAAALSIEEAAGLTLMLPAYPRQGPAHWREVVRRIRTARAGGVIVFQGGPQQTLQMVRFLQEHTPWPLLFAIDAEWGAAMRLDSTFAFPKAMTLGALPDTRWTYRTARRIADQLRRLGIHINFAPVVDINSNPQNPIIHLRSFGETPDVVIPHATAYLHGLRVGGVTGVIKHFPGHGDTHKDSHKDLPRLDHPAELLRRRELAPFQALIKAGAPAVMVGHLLAPALSPSDVPAPFDRRMIDSLLRREMGFDGVVVTDALNMAGATLRLRPEEIGVRAIDAGCDILLMPPDPAATHRRLAARAHSDTAFRRRLYQSARRILRLRYRHGLTHRPSLPPPDTLPRGLALRADSLLVNHIAQLAVSAWKSDPAMEWPPTRLDSPRRALLIVNDTPANEVERMFRRYGLTAVFYLHDTTPYRRWQTLRRRLGAYDEVIISLHGQSMWNSRTFGISKTTWTRLQNLHREKPAVVFNFGSPYALRYFPHAKVLVQAYEDHPFFHRAAVHHWAGAGRSRLLQGETPSQRIPVTPFGAFGLRFRPAPTAEGRRLFYCFFPEEAGAPFQRARRLDSMVGQAIDSHAMPGCQVLASYDHRVWWWGRRGFHTYDSVRPVGEFDRYDAASLTKVFATTLAVMALYEEGRLALDDTLGRFLPRLRGTPRGTLTIEELLTHTSGLPAWIPFYQWFLAKEKQTGLRIFARTSDSTYRIPVTPTLYMHAAYLDTLRLIADTVSLKGRGTYRYSDLGMFYLHEVAEAVTGEPMEAFLRRRFWEPMGLTATGYTPFLRGEADECVPAEVDTYWRHDTLRGAVHDMAAAMMGGTAGHAGLFTNIHDVGKLMWMLASEGEYGGRRYLSAATIRRFTRSHCPAHRRGLGFDKPACSTDEPSPAGRTAPRASFGHSGFTGTYFWVVPRRWAFLRGLPYFGRFYRPAYLFAFLSNRTFPSMDNRRLIDLNVRTRLFDEGNLHPSPSL